MMAYIRLLVSWFLIVMVALGHTWALVTILVLMTLSHEVSASSSQ